ncbi:MAG: LacI family transcriptional regulator [Candidatus Poribacteria bacterium]|nr:MAG: LacI family transcriptional regulator [Candidatus Poribacteria bacterium]
MSRILDVARRAGVSTATVSRVLNGDPRVRPETAQRVREAIQALNYVPPPPTDRRRRNARSRLGIHTGKIAVLIPTAVGHPLKTVLSARLLAGMEEAARAADLQLLITGLPEPERLPPTIDRRHIDGLIVRAPVGSREWLPPLIRHVPYVWLFEPGAVEVSGDIVLPDNARVGALALEYLLERGRRRLAVVMDRAGHPSLLRRTEAFLQAARRQGIADVRVIEPEPPERTTLPQRLLPILQAPGRPDGLFLPGAETGAAILGRLLQEIGCRLGRELDAIGCLNDENLLSALGFWANVDIRPEAIGKAAVETLLWRLSHPEEPYRRVQVAPALQRLRP